MYVRILHFYAKITLMTRSLSINRLKLCRVKKKRSGQKKRSTVVIAGNNAQCYHCFLNRRESRQNSKVHGYKRSKKKQKITNSCNNKNDNNNSEHAVFVRFTFVVSRDLAKIHDTEAYYERMSQKRRFFARRVTKDVLCAMERYKFTALMLLQHSHDIFIF